MRKFIISLIDKIIVPGSIFINSEMQMSNSDFVAEDESEVIEKQPAKPGPAGGTATQAASMGSDIVAEDDSPVTHQVLPLQQTHHTKQELPQENAGLPSAAAIS